MHGRRIPAKLDEDTPLRLDVEIDGSVVEQVSSHKIFGVVIDSQMNYKSHTDELCKKLSKRIGLLKHISPFLKILGIFIDNQMNYKSHIDELCKKLSKRIGLLKHISPFLKQRQREIYYSCVIKPTLLYGSMKWDSCNVEHLQSILKLQKERHALFSMLKDFHHQSYYSII